MADDKLLSFFGNGICRRLRTGIPFFQDEYDDSLALAMAAVDDNIITFKYVISIFLTVKNQTRRLHLVRTKTRRLFLELSGEEIFSAEFADGSKVSAEKLDSRPPVNFTFLLTSLSSSLRNWTPCWTRSSAINHSSRQKTGDTGLPDGEGRIPLRSLV